MKAGAVAFPGRTWLAATVAAFAVLLGWQRLFGLAPIDDAYIFLRYARNWTEGLGPVFNTGERVEGYSSPLWLALMAGGQRLAPGSTWLASAVGAGCAAITIGTVVAEAVRRGVPAGLAGCAGLFMVTSPGIVFWSGSGMDTALFSLLATATMLGFCRDLERGRLTPATSALLSATCLARSEGLLLLGVIAVFAWRSRRSFRWRWLILAVVVCGAALVARRLYYGEWLPNTYFAKVAGGRSVVWSNGARYGLALAGTHGGPLLWLGLALALAARAGRSPAMGPCLAVLLLWPAYLVWTGGDHFAMGRLVQPLVPMLVVTGLVALDGIRRGMPRARPALLGLAVLALAATSVTEWRREGPRARSEMAAGTRWCELGTWLAARLPADAWIAAVPIGGIGWGSDGPLLDLTGLTNATIARHGSVDRAGRPGHLKFHGSYVLERAPAVVFLNFGGRAVGDFPLFTGYNMALQDLLGRERTRALYRPEVCEVAPGRYAHLLVRRDLPSLAGGPRADP